MKIPYLKFRPFCFVLLLSLGFGAASPLNASVFSDLDEGFNPEEADVFLENDGVVVMEVESMSHDPEHWDLETSIDGYSGSGYLVGKTDTFKKGGLGKLRYPFKVETSGVYQLNWKVRITTGDHRGEHNDAFARILDSEENLLDTVNHENERDADPNWYKVFMNRLGQWSYDSKNLDGVGVALAWDLEAGKTYYFEISVRSAGAGLDRIVLWNQSLQNFGDKVTGRVASEAPMDALSESKRNVEVDTDGDGLPDTFEERYADLSLEADSDPDGDGLSNGMEYVLGTDPRSPSEGIRVEQAFVDGARYLDYSYSFSEEAVSFYRIVPAYSLDLGAWAENDSLGGVQDIVESGVEGVSIARMRMPVSAVDDAFFMKLRIERVAE
ncbi:thrombospondin type 3 repeat-containing protein [Pelagicoccus mobilis]|uniref:Gylcosyl hydrolase 115 C-terminal domain-containing protein n=1 Tax=Pelagicoccus mobilis TaxID=415221 RepID=A0A934VQF4_9BACT|nr:thrombospondin type 3 repeat-containing protein [Pelagicoccus mobilis]MBK1876439.1 hypothetical protein [Pelagicoccus mobilis]